MSPSHHLPPAADARHAERLVAQSQALLGAAGGDGRLRWLSPAWQHWMGYDDRQLYAQPYLSFVHPDDVVRVRDFAARLARMAPGESLQLEVRVRRADGEHRWLRCSATVADAPESLAYLSATDVSDLREALGELARRGAELERSNAELERFASVVSHDLRSSLTAVAGFLELIEYRYGEELAGGARSLLGSAQRSADRMRALVEDLLAYARVGHSGREREPVDVGALARGVAATVAPRARLRLGPGLPTVRALPRELEQLLANLIGNAAKFVAADVEPEIELTAAREGGGWRFELADNGIGLPSERAGDVFGMFARLHEADGYPGSGIGLAIAEKVVESAGGRIWARPRAGGGTVFAFTWPDRQ